ncbi:RHS repeat protein [Sphingorhabdus sp. Alg239-R122]|uniref:RHS repeat protein n=1 Tax=Sphingorhabdus sp. Alg239-R122 TaxID=2305989 RepID=UPI0013DBB906|nr:RHS repeat protein [Sphingorhabdus sp. Alg239-R122]
MVAIFTGLGSGLEGGSGSVLGAGGLLGQSSLGRAGEQLFFNAANGNLLISHRDEFLVGRGPDVGISRTYNSQGGFDGDNDDKWQQSTYRRVHGLTGTVNTAGSTVRRTGADGSDIEYAWDSTENAYVSKAGGGAHDQLTFASNVWTWTDGDSRITEKYDDLNSGRITEVRDTDNQKLTFAYDMHGRLETVTTADGGYVTYAYEADVNSVPSQNIAEVITSYTDYANANAPETLTRVSYTYDYLGRLKTVTTDLTPHDTTDSETYTTSYLYVTSTGGANPPATDSLVSQITQSDKSKINIAYALVDGEYRVSQFDHYTRWNAFRTTTITYDTANNVTTVTDAAGGETKLRYDAEGRLVELTAPPEDATDPSSLSQVIRYTYDADGNLVSMTETDSAPPPTHADAGLGGNEIDTAGWPDDEASAPADGTGLTANWAGWNLAETKWEETEGPYGQSPAASLVLGNDSGTAAAGGGTTTGDFTIDDTKSYEFTYYFKKEDGPAGHRLRFGPGSTTDTNTQMLRNRDGVASQWPYFIDIGTADQDAKLTAGKWYKVVGYVLDKNQTATAPDGTHGGVYDLETGAKIDGLNTISYRWNPSRVDNTVGSMFFAAGAIADTYDTHIFRPEVRDINNTAVLTGTDTLDVAMDAALLLGQNIGRTTTYTHDADGNVIMMRDAEGNTVTRTYGANNEMLTQTRWFEPYADTSVEPGADEASTVRYVYDSENHMRFIVSAENNVIEYVYRGTGELERVITFPDHPYEHPVGEPVLNHDDAPSLTQVATWRTSQGDLSQVELVYNLFDARGNVKRTIQLGEATTDGTMNWGAADSSTTYYTYDQAGQLLERRLVGQTNTETFVYDGLGRVVLSNDFNNAETSIVFNDAAIQTVVTLESGLTRTSTYNNAGELLHEIRSVNGANDRSSKYAYNDRGQLRMATDSLDKHTHFFHDDAGRKVLDVAPDGSLTEYKYDSEGRLVATVVYHEQLDATQLASLASGFDPVDVDYTTLLPGTAHAGDIWQWNVYDDAGRLVQVIDGAGSVTEFTFDGAGRLLKTVSYDDILDVTALKTTLPTEAIDTSAFADAADRISRNFYDGDGRLVGTLDGAGYLSETGYDHAGRMTQEIAYAGATAVADRLNGDFATLKAGLATTAQADRDIRYTYDNKGQLRFTANNGGQLTEYIYDEPGRLIRTTQYAAVLPDVSSTAYPDGDYSYDNMQTVAGTMADAVNDRASYNFYDAAGRLFVTSDAEGQVSRFTYDDTGRLIKAVAYAGVHDTDTADTFFTMASWTNGQASNAENRVTRTYYNEKSEVIYTVDGEGFVTQNEYDVESQVTWTRRFDSAIAATDTTVLADIAGLLGASAYAETAFTYDANGRVSRTTDAENIITSYAYNGSGQIESMTEAFGTADARATEYGYDGAGRVISEKHAAGTGDEITLGYAYDGLGNLTQETDANGNVTTHEYDVLGRVTKTISPAVGGQSVEVSTSYDGFGQTISQTNANGRVTTFSYDQLGRLTGQTRASGTADAATSSFAYTHFGDLTETTNANNDKTHIFHDDLGREILSVDTEGYVTGTAYNGFGQVESVTRYENAIGAIPADGSLPSIGSGAGNDVVTAAGDITSSFAYDELGRLISETRPIDTDNNINAVTSFVYDSQGNLVQTVDANGKNSYNYYDDIGRLTLSIDGEGYAVSTEYNKLDEVLSVTRHAGQTSGAALNVPPTVISDTNTDSVTSYAYDALGRVDSQTQTLTGSATAQVQFTYDAAGNLVKSINANNGVTHNYYNALNRLTDSLDAEGYLTSWTYDDNGNVLTETRYAAAYTGTVDPDTPPTVGAPSSGSDIETGDADTVMTYVYDALDRVTGETRAIDGTSNAETLYEYDAVGNLVKVTDPNLNVAYNYYDKLGRVVLSVDAEGYATETGYDSFGDVASVTRYETAFDISAIDENTMPDVATIDDAANDATTTFTYDDLGRVISTTDALGFTESYTLDANGNRISVTNKLNGTITNVYDDRGLLISETLPQTIHGANGNVIATTVTNTFEYDARGNRTKMTEAAGLTEARVTLYRYDLNDRLIETEYAAVDVIGEDLDTVTADVVPLETAIYDANGNVIETVALNGMRTFHYYDALNRQVASVEAQPTTVPGDYKGTLSENSYDANGNVTATRVYDSEITVTSGAAAPAPLTADTYRETVFEYDGLNRMTQSTVKGLDVGRYETSYILGENVPVSTQYAYDKNGNIIEQTDAYGDSITSYYDSLDRKIAQVDQLGYLTKWDHDSDGNVLTETRFAGAFAGTPGATPPSVTPDSDNDRVTTFTYDKNGQRLTETRHDVASWQYVLDGNNDPTGAINARSNAENEATVSFAYNGLGQVTNRTEATGDYTDYGYDATGRLGSVTTSAFAAYGETGNVQQQTDNYYDGLGNLVRSEVGKAGGAAANDRVTSYAYGKGGRLESVTDAAGNVRSYAYDVAGQLLKESYDRTLSDGTTTETEAIATRYDQRGRVVFQSVAQDDAVNGWEYGDSNHMLYNAHGEMMARGINIATADIGDATKYQEFYEYDAGGRMWRTNSGDGVTKLFGYDANGRQTIALTSAGTDISAMTVLQARDEAEHADAATNAKVNATYTLYDARGQVVQGIEEGRELAVSAAAAPITTSRAYNAFGDMVSDTDALGYTTTYTYNTMGRVLRKESPVVSITLENGTSNWVKPSEDYFYDISGRLLGKDDANGGYSLSQGPLVASAKDDVGLVSGNSGNRTTYLLLEGTGYGGGEAVIRTTFNADGGKKSTEYDVFGDAREMTDEIGRVTTQTFDNLGRLTQVTQERGAGTTDDFHSYYRYDELGQRTAHTNSFHGSANFTGSDKIETTDYDVQGRVVSQKNFAGDDTQTSYSWDAAATTTGLGTFGGWTQTVSTIADRANSNIHAAASTSDMFGHMVTRTDMGGYTYDYTYDIAGRMTQETYSLAGATKQYEYYNTGQVSKLTAGRPEVTNTNWSNKVGTYEYDALGRLTAEKLVEHRATYEYVEGTPDPILLSTHFQVEQMFDPDLNDPNPGSRWVYTKYSPATLQDGSVTYDALGRMTSYTESPPTGNGDDVAHKTWAYDAAGNIRKVSASYRAMDANGNLSATAITAPDLWYSYDVMNRIVVTKGISSGGNILAGTNGTAMTYDQAGRRMTAKTGTKAMEYYSYTDAGQLEQVRNNSVSGTLRVSNTYDDLGRLTKSDEYNSSGSFVHSRYDIEYDARDLVLAEKAKTRQVEHDSTVYWLFSHTANKFTEDGTGVGSPDHNGPNYLIQSTGATLADSEVKYWRASNSGYVLNYSGSAQEDLDYKDTDTDHFYIWRDGAVQDRVVLDNAYSQGSSGVNPGISNYNYDSNGHLLSVVITGGDDPRTISYASDMNGQIVDRREWVSGADPSTRTYMFGGRQMGVVGNNGTGNVDYDAQIDTRDAQQPDENDEGIFRDGTDTGTPFADFDANFVHMNAATTGGSAGSYTVQGGESLQQIAAAVWGDAALWYKIAEANGLNGSEPLAAGRSLTIPSGVHNVHNNAGTFQVYNPAEAIGNTTPGTPAPPKADNGCGTLGVILSLVVATAVNVLFSLTPLAPIAPVLADGARQISLNLTGNQKGINFKELGIAGVRALVGGPVGGDPITAATSGAFNEILVQGISTVTGLQDSFSWTSVAVAGVGAGAGSAAGIAANAAGLGNLGSRVATTAAATIAGAATRSALTGTSFGGNLASAGSVAVGQLAGGLLAEGLYSTFDGISSNKGRSGEATRSEADRQRETDGQSVKDSAEAQNADNAVNEIVVYGSKGGGSIDLLSQLGFGSGFFDYSAHAIVNTGKKEFIPGLGDSTLIRGQTERDIPELQKKWREALANATTDSARTEINERFRAEIARLENQAVDAGKALNLAQAETTRPASASAAAAQAIANPESSDQQYGMTATFTRPLFDAIGGAIQSGTDYVVSRYENGRDNIDAGLTAGSAGYYATQIAYAVPDAAFAFTGVVGNGIGALVSGVGRPVQTIKAPFIAAGNAVDFVTRDNTSARTYAARGYDVARTSSIRDYSKATGTVLGYGAEILGPAKFAPKGAINPTLGGRVGGFTSASRQSVIRANVAPIHKNSLSYVGDTHVYAVRSPDGSLYKVGESAQGLRKRDSASIRAEQQARALQRATGNDYTTEIRQTFGTKADARSYETRFIQTYTRLYGRPPGNPLDR